MHASSRAVHARDGGGGGDGAKVLGVHRTNAHAVELGVHLGPLGRTGALAGDDICGSERGRARAVAASPSVALVDVRQSLEFSEWRVPPSINCPYAVPDPNVFRRAVGFAISIKGGLKVRNPNFVEQCRAAVDGKKTVVLIDVKGGDLSVAPAREGSGVLDVTDSQALRAAYELSQAGFRDVRYARGGLPGAVDRGDMPYESEKWGTFLEWLDGVNPEQRKLLMYSRLLPDPTNLPGVVGQAAIFALIGLAYYDVGGVGTWAAENVPAACSFLPVCL